MRPSPFAQNANVRQQVLRRVHVRAWNTRHEAVPLCALIAQRQTPHRAIKCATVKPLASHGRCVIVRSTVRRRSALKAALGTNNRGLTYWMRNCGGAWMRAPRQGPASRPRPGLGLKARPTRGRLGCCGPFCHMHPPRTEDGRPPGASELLLARLFVIAARRDC
jgi:hypothetical protein